MYIKRPMKAPIKPITEEELYELNTTSFPLFGSPKLDGFRCTIVDGKARTASMKLIQNKFTQNYLSNINYSGLDGELVVGYPNSPEAFHNTSGPLRRYDGKPDFKFYIFDDFTRKDASYRIRLSNMNNVYYNDPDGRIIILRQQLLYSVNDVIMYEKKMLSLGYEGVMIRSLHAPYKEGRATYKEAYIFKRKPFIDCDALIVGFEEAMENQNDISYDSIGLTVRSSHNSGLVPKNTLGAFILKASLWKDTFRCGTGIGLTAELRKKVWDNKDLYLNKIVTIKYQSHGSIDAPRLPVFKWFKPDWDITE